MATISKRRKAMTGKVDHAKSYPVLDAMGLIKQTATAKFDEAVDVAVNPASTPRSQTRRCAARSCFRQAPGRRCA